jgi:hypothetical protein
MDAREDGEVSKLSPGGCPRGQAATPVPSLSEEWLHALDKCAIDSGRPRPSCPLMPSCFVGGAKHAVLLLQTGHGDQLASDIASFLVEGPQSRHPKSSACGINLGMRNCITLARSSVESDKIVGADQLQIKATQPI